MFGKMLSDLTEAATAVVKVAVLPVALTATVVREVTKPIGDAAEDAANAVSDGLASKPQRQQ